jgi:hypothetical protein
MKEVLGALRKPDTGKPADDAEVKTIESLSDLINLINEQAQRPNQNNPPPENADQNEEMQFLMQMAREANARPIATRPTPKLSSPGGTAARAGSPLSGNAAGKAAGSRAVNQAAGTIENAPAEFRDALENYYHGLEQSKE